MKTYYDGEEREIVSIEPYYRMSDTGKIVFRIRYKRGESVGELAIAATDELDAFNRFPDELARASVIHTDED